jgi:hypothetical protein
LIGSGVLTPSVFMVLVNAIYFKGNWASQFDEKRTRKDRFHINFEEDIEVDMMYQKKKFHFTYNPKLLCSVLELPYKGNSLSMVFILPDTIDGFLGAALIIMTTPVAAAASVPSSLTSTKAWWITAEMKTFFILSIPEKSAFPLSNA